VFLETSLAEPEGVGPMLPGGKLLDSLGCFAARHGLGVVWAGVKDHPPEPLLLGPITAFFGQDGEVAYGEVAVNALVDAAELIGSFSPLATPHELPHSLNARSLAVRAPPRAARWVIPSHAPRKTRFRLLVRLYRTGWVTRKIADERFLASGCSAFLSFLARWVVCSACLPRSLLSVTTLSAVSDDTSSPPNQTNSCLRRQLLRLDRWDKLI